ncbi:DUF2854 domain-containing protein [Synechococcus sp. PCC 7336]|uniref:DUF2854 domain-containing protein n=1 Tax=Synechococcus sp. PCC 7336 TaxID=195250 RepID=UPI00034AD19A|nr:DUF2854 domain-containing protein [Synechococcus sp. PCC 7336]
MFERLPFALSTLPTIAGAILLVWGLIEYNTPTLNLIGFSAGIPLLLGGLVMKAVELKPVPLMSPVTPEIEQARSQQSTEIQQQIITDITKYNYGADAHLDTALEALKLKGRTDAELPRIQTYGEQLRDGKYTLVLRFETSRLPFEKWEESYEKKMKTFFGRDVDVELTQPGKDLAEIALIVKSDVPETEAAAS